MAADIVLTCEHAGNSIPESYRHLFPDAASGILSSHRGWDPGAWDAATVLADRLNLSLYGCHTSRLLIEVNRSLHHAELFSEFSAPLVEVDKEFLIAEIYRPYREAVIERMRRGSGLILHLSLHSFTPVLHGKVRDMEIGLLFDPGSPLETDRCNYLKGSLLQNLPGTRVAFNEPYRGVDDGFTTSLRETFPAGRYAGIEIELNQKFIGTHRWEDMKEGLVDAVRDLRDLPSNP